MCAGSFLCVLRTALNFVSQRMTIRCIFTDFKSCKMGFICHPSLRNVRKGKGLLGIVTVSWRLGWAALG